MMHGLPGLILTGLFMNPQNPHNRLKPCCEILRGQRARKPAYAVFAAEAGRTYYARVCMTAGLIDECS
jgi:hypothetical protein